MIIGADVLFTTISKDDSIPEVVHSFVPITSTPGKSGFTINRLILDAFLFLEYFPHILASEFEVSPQRK